MLFEDRLWLTALVVMALSAAVGWGTGAGLFK